MAGSDASGQESALRFGVGDRGGITRVDVIEMQDCRAEARQHCGSGPMNTESSKQLIEVSL